MTCIKTNVNKQRAAVTLKRSIRQIDRMIAGYKEYGKAFFVHGNRDRKPKHALTDDFKTEIELLYINKYFDCTYTKFKEFLETRENINLSIDFFIELCYKISIEILLIYILNNETLLF